MTHSEVLFGELARNEIVAGKYNVALLFLTLYLNISSCVQWDAADYFVFQTFQLTICSWILLTESDHNQCTRQCL